MSLSRPKTSNSAVSEYKLVVLGCRGVGKSALAKQFVHARFQDDYDPTMSDVYRKQCVIDDEAAVVEITHAVGQDDFSSFRDSALRRGEGFLLVFALNSRSSFQELVNLQQQILQVKDADNFPMVLVGNKSDTVISRRQVSPSEAKELAASFGCSYVETSAKSRHNVEEAFHELVRAIRASGPPKKSASPSSSCLLA